MNNVLNEKQKQFYKAVSSILWNDWDPIGVNDISDLDDEYDSYVPHIFRLAIEGKDVIHIANSLALTVENEIGLGVDYELNRRVAEKILLKKMELLG